MAEVKKRRSLTPQPLASQAQAGVTVEDVHATRRGGARHEVSSRVTLKAKSGAVLEGWALNVSRGGIRVILEDKVELGDELEVTISSGASASSGASGEEAATPVIGRVVWVQEEPDGVVAGIEFR